MTREYVALDIETAKDVPGPDFNWKRHRPLGITCVATVQSDLAEPMIWFSKNPGGIPAPRMSRQDCLSLLDYLWTMVGKGYTVLTWNGLGFDFDVLSEESGDFARCKDLALNHVDMMFHVFCDRGFPVALDKAAKALGIPGKPSGISGSLAPQLWAQGRHQEVMDYVAQDARITLQVAHACERTRSFSWITKKGSVGSMELRRGWLAVKEALRLPEPDTSWMDDPMRRERFIEWVKP
ncbi:MAG TPA: ribonuclease H-like domain-containing protein [Syntrophorhabdales bacterium]|nr:ribonuclease H-like domain-containing protein [Syntrophorhabdales bacterium]